MNPTMKEGAGSIEELLEKYDIKDLIHPESDDGDFLLCYSLKPDLRPINDSSDARLFWRLKRGNFRLLYSSMSKIAPFSLQKIASSAESPLGRKSGLNEIFS